MYSTVQVPDVQIIFSSPLSTDGALLLAAAVLNHSSLPLVPTAV